MKKIAPSYYTQFSCIAEKCKHTCCKGWEIDVDNQAKERFLRIPEIKKHISTTNNCHIHLNSDESCPFLNENGLCDMITNYGESMICNICRDHPRFRNYWSDCIEIGLGLVCEEAGRILLSQKNPLELIVIDDDFNCENLSEDEQWLRDLRNQMLLSIRDTGPKARLMEYLIYRHIPDALYDGLLDERIAFINNSFDEILHQFELTEKSFDDFVECCRCFSYDVEYDDEELCKRIKNALK